MRTPAHVWDFSTRLFHWCLVLLFALSWWTAETGRMEQHRWSGYAILGLLVYRVYWGFVGGSTARFAAFLKGPRAVAAYARALFTSRYAHAAGHNPAGALSVTAMLALLIAQVTLGLFAVDVDGLESGPLSQYVSFDQGRFAAHWHHVGFNILLALIALHVAAIAFYAAVKRVNLLGPMITGRSASAPEGLEAAPWLRALPGLALAAAVVFAVMKGFKF